MRRFIIRLDDASEYMDLKKWSRIEKLLDEHEIKPIFGIIPDNRDEALVGSYYKNPNFWELVNGWISKGWIPAMHGFQHKYVTNEGGINPVNHKSEFAGLPYDEQADKIKKGWQILLDHDIKPEIFFAPSHTFDENTLKAIKNESSIRIISDTPAWDVYKSGEFFYIPQQSGKARNLPFKTVTFCYHPNTMNDGDFKYLDHFFSKYRNLFISDSKLINDRKKNLADILVNRLYFVRRR